MRVKDIRLRLFSDKRSVARQRYRRCVEGGLVQGRRDDLIRSAGVRLRVKAMQRQHAVRKSDERPLGNGQFVERVLREAEERMERRLGLQALGVDLDTVIRRVCEVTSCPEQDVQKPGKDR